MSSPENLPLDKADFLNKIPLVVILGPTAVGKSEIAIQLAEKFSGEIVSADSRLFYCGMDIGTAKPTLKDRSNVPHYLIDVANPDEIWSLALFQAEANKAIHRIFDNRHLPFLVGGTGQFIHSITEGWSVPPVEPNPRMREVLTYWSEQLGPAAIHSKLAILDPEAAKSIDPPNVRRTVRALEVVLTSGKRFSNQKASGHKLYHPLLLGLTRPRSELYQRIDVRIAMMIESGFISEVQQLLDSGYSTNLPTLSAIGYREIIEYVTGKISLEEAIRLMKCRTRIFVRRQANWFKENDPDIHWFQVNKNTTDEMTKMINHWLTEINWDEISSCCD